jgi:hypothetical protein
VVTWSLGKKSGIACRSITKIEVGTSGNPTNILYVKKVMLNIF